jgi:hypothetical protein
VTGRRRAVPDDEAPLTTSRIRRPVSVTETVQELAPPIRQSLGSVDTERMHLRPFESGDLDSLAAVFAKPEVWRFP